MAKKHTITAADFDNKVYLRELSFSFTLNGKCKSVGIYNHLSSGELSSKFYVDYGGYVRFSHTLSEAVEYYNSL